MKPGPVRVFTTFICFLSLSWTTFSLHADVIPIKSHNGITTTGNWVSHFPPRPHVGDMQTRTVPKLAVCMCLPPPDSYINGSAVSFLSSYVLQQIELSSSLSGNLTFLKAITVGDSPNVDGRLQKWPTSKNPMSFFRIRADLRSKLILLVISHHSPTMSLSGDRFYVCPDIRREHSYLRFVHVTNWNYELSSYGALKMGTLWLNLKLLFSHELES